MTYRYVEPKKCLFDIVGLQSCGVNLTLKVGLVPMETTCSHLQSHFPSPVFPNGSQNKKTSTTLKSWNVKIMTGQKITSSK